MFDKSIVDLEYNKYQNFKNGTKLKGTIPERTLLQLKREILFDKKGWDKLVEVGLELGLS